MYPEQLPQSAQQGGGYTTSQNGPQAGYHAQGYGGWGTLATNSGGAKHRNLLRQNTKPEGTISSDMQIRCVIFSFSVAMFLIFITTVVGITPTTSALIWKRSFINALGGYVSPRPITYMNLGSNERMPDSPFFKPWYMYSSTVCAASKALEQSSLTITGNLMKTVVGTKHLEMGCINEKQYFRDDHNNWGIMEKLGPLGEKVSSSSSVVEPRDLKGTCQLQACSEWGLCVSMAKTRCQTYTYGNYIANMMSSCHVFAFGALAMSIYLLILERHVEEDLTGYNDSSGPAAQNKKVHSSRLQNILSYGPDGPPLTSAIGANNAMMHGGNKQKGSSQAEKVRNNNQKRFQEVANGRAWTFATSCYACFCILGCQFIWFLWVWVNLHGGGTGLPPVEYSWGLVLLYIGDALLAMGTLVVYRRNWVLERITKRSSES